MRFLIHTTRRLRALAAALAWAALSAQAADGRGLARLPLDEQRVALVVGNSDYAHAGHLDNPDNDARLIAKTLQGQGFTLVGGKALLDLDKRRMDEAVQAFGRELAPGSVALFYYAGHGNEIGGTNYLLPVDANPYKPSDFDFQTLNATAVLRQMQDAGTRLNIVILDACRDNPFSGRGLRAAAAGLASMEPPEGTLIAYAAGVGKKAQDGPRDGNSPYSAALAQAMAQTGLPLWQTFNTVGLRVKEATGGTQTPWISNEPIKGEFCFAGCVGMADADVEAKLRAAEERIRQLESAKQAAPNPLESPAPAVKQPPKSVPEPADLSIEIEQGGGQATPQGQSNYWYYCADSQAYYPYVKECPGGWQQVAPLEHRRGTVRRPQSG